MTQHDDGIWIESLCAPPGEEQAMCRITWDGLVQDVTVTAVRTTAEDLFTCAAYADMMGQFLKLDFPGNVVQGVMTDILSSSAAAIGRPYFGTKSTFKVIPGASSTRKAGGVILQRGSRQRQIDPDEARAMARQWLECADASESDRIVRDTLVDFGMDPARCDMFFALMRTVRGDIGPQPV